MEEIEKMAALKKAYADIILNTEKEAAARIMVSERKALQFQQELFAAKEEALNLLLRLKQMMDSKIAEAEIASLSQRRKIEELEAQLHEAEDAVTDLRAQLKGVQDELEKMNSNPVQPFDDYIAKERAAYHEDALQENKLTTFESIILPPLDSGPGSISTSDMNDTPLSQRNIEDHCCFVSENATETELSRDSPAEKYYDGNPDFASIIMRSKESELYRNGCTQRIRAFERNLLNGKLPLPEQTDDQYSHIKNEAIIKEDEKAEGTCTVASPKDDSTGLLEKKLTTLEELLPLGSSCDKGQAVKFFRRFSSRKRRTRYRNANTALCADPVKQACEPSALSRCNTHPYPDHSIVESGKHLSSIIEEDARKNSDCHLAPLLNTAEVEPRSGCTDDTGSDAEVIKAANTQSAADENIALIDKSDLAIQDHEVAVSSGVPICKLNQAVDVPLMSSDSKVQKTCEITNGTPSQVVNDRLLKYTFRRKRKKESLSCPEENVSLEKNTTKRRSGEKQNGASEPQKSSLIMESSRDSRRLVQVARQLISLSEKQWW